MAKRSSSPAPSVKPVVSLTPDQMRSGITKLERRISELKMLDIRQFPSGDDPAILALEASIESTLQEVFGLNTAEYDRYINAKYLDLTDYSIGWMGGREGNIYEGLTKGCARAVALLEQAVKSLKEHLEDLGETKSGRALRAYEGLDLHPEIVHASSKLYRDGHYASAIEDAVKALNDLVRLRSGQNLDGTTLMETVFSAKRPILKFNDLADQSDHDEQKGFMMMFSGAVAGL